VQSARPFLRNRWQCTYPGPHSPEPGEAIEGTTRIEKLCDAGGRDTWKSRTVRLLSAFFPGNQ
jgi:hypothetical protein